MSQKLENIEDINSEIIKRSEKEIRKEEIKNQETIKNFIESEKIGNYLTFREDQIMT